ncbi:MAG: hypothetical protein QOJ35_2111 [Solirubrobacteraceae bacterium]|nr:hypothetical protein [Solirubrobacteraceae bacterium]
MPATSSDARVTRKLSAARRRPRRAVALALGAALAVGGCGGHDFANDPRPAAPITVSAVVTPKRVTGTPPRFGAGTIELLVSNQTATSQRLQLRSERLAPGGRTLAQTTGPINPGDTATLKLDVDEGTYLVSVRSARIEPAELRVGPPRASAQDQLLQP